MVENPRPGTIFAGYLIERVLGGGGMGTVYAARHPRLPRREALKVLSAGHSADAEYRARFIREAELTARLNHPNVIAVHDRGMADERLWIAMQFVDGTDAGELCRHGAANPERALRIVELAARGLDEAHRAGMVHRDVKPANILIEPRPDGTDRVLVTDFGIGRAASQSTVLTEEGSVLATLAYAAPEQLMGLPVDHRADVYALGCTLYELLTGTKPFPRATPALVIHAHLQDPPPRPTAVNSALPPAIDAVIARAMAKQTHRRYDSCGALAAAALAAFAGTPDTVRALPSPGVRSVAHRRRTKLWAVIAALTLVIALGVAGAVALRDNSAESVATSAAVTPTRTTSVAASTTPRTASWGSHASIARTFPGLLPATPNASGYQGVQCVALDEDSRPVDLNTPVQGRIRLGCNGNKDPLTQMLVVCDEAGTRMEGVQKFKNMTILGDERWERVSGTGRIIWGDRPNPTGAPAGAMVITFDDDGRSNCQIMASGGNSGQDLLDRWWRDAPI